MVEELKALFGSMNDPGTAYDPNYSDDWNDDAAAFLRKHGQELVEAMEYADRYRWLRDRCDTTTGFMLSQRLERDEWDEAIDNAMSGGK